MKTTIFQCSKNYCSPTRVTILKFAPNMADPISLKDCYFKDRQMGHYVLVSLWCESLSINTILRFVYLRMNNQYAQLMLHPEKGLPNYSGRPLYQFYQ